MSRFTVHDLAATIDARAASGGETSYTRKLLGKGSLAVEKDGKQIARLKAPHIIIATGARARVLP